MEEIIYVLKGHRRGSDSIHIIDLIDGKDEADELLISLNSEMPHWKFWIDIEPRVNYDVHSGVAISQLDGVAV